MELLALCGGDPVQGIAPTHRQFHFCPVEHQCNLILTMHFLKLVGELLRIGLPLHRIRASRVQCHQQFRP
ncbi:hypothetical protein RsoM2USA_452 [Ralstonia phage RsoM2USA]|nr:hypothetical protein RsoM2USA_452 [Ralstonia phage RsoM2USA]